MALGGSVSFSEEISFNPQTCETKVATATLSQSQINQIDALTGEQTTLDSAQQTNPAAAASSASKSQTAAFTPVYSRWIKTQWVDPIFIVITAQRAQLEWTNTSWRRYAYLRYGFAGCVNGFCIVECCDRTVIVGQNSSLVGVTNGWRYNTQVHLLNYHFEWWVEHFLGAAGKAACGWPSSSRADFWHSDTVTGYKNGYAGWAWSDSKSGACTALVHHTTNTAPGFP